MERLYRWKTSSVLLGIHSAKAGSRPGFLPREAFGVRGVEDRLKLRHRVASSRSISTWSAAALSAQVGR